MTMTQSLLRSPVVAALTSPHGIDRYLELVHPMWVVEEVRARVVDVRRETTAGAPVATLTLRPTRTWAGHRAGQFVQLGVEVDGARRTRCFSVSSAESGPGDDITVTMRANPDGLVSKYLVEHARPGLVVHLSQAAGEFVLPEPLPTRLLLVSGGSGITPVMSMVRTLLLRGYGGHVTFLHYAQSPDHQIYAEELADLPPHIDVRLLHPESGDEPFTAEGLAAIIPDFREVDTWACGPPGLVEKVQDAYSGSDALRVEYFKTTTVRAGSALGPVEGRVEFSASGQAADNTGATLLEQAEALGLRPDFGCRMGICFTCTSRKTAGTVRNIVTGAESALPDEDIQLCVSAPVGDCVVDL